MIHPEVQKLETDALVSMYELDTTPIGGTLIYRFTAMPRGSAPIAFNGNVYEPIDIEVDGFNWDGQGAFPRPRIRISNVAGLVTGAIVTMGDIIGARFKRIRTFARHLDDGADPDPDAVFPAEIYTVDQRTKHTKVFVEWQLAAYIDQIGVMIPRRQCLRDTCSHTYRTYNSDTSSFDYAGVTCPYTGSAKFTEAGTSTGNAALDSCGRRVVDCRKRFGDNAVLPTRAFPGVARVRT